MQYDKWIRSSHI